MNERALNLKLQNHQSAFIGDNNTGELTEVKSRANNIPEGMSRLDYDNFGMINLDMLAVLRRHLSNTQIGIIMAMIMRAEYQTNSLAPLNSETSVRELSEIFDIGINQVTKTFEKLKDLGIFGTLKIATDRGNEFWILNPYIYWKGKLKDDSIFKHFLDTKITKYLYQSK